MDYNEIKQIMEDMENSSLSSIDINLPDGTKISIKKEVKDDIKTLGSTAQLTDESNIKKDTNKDENVKIDNSQNKNIVKSPMVGTFYIKPSPTSDPYTEVGKEVKKGDTLCIIEAMKLMNEIESEFDGKVTEILVQDGESVEYGKPLFVIE